MMDKSKNCRVTAIDKRGRTLKSGRCTEEFAKRIVYMFTMKGYVCVLTHE